MSSIFSKMVFLWLSIVCSSLIGICPVLILSSAIVISLLNLSISVKRAVNSLSVSSSSIKNLFVLTCFSSVLLSLLTSIPQLNCLRNPSFLLGLTLRSSDTNDLSSVLASSCLYVGPLMMINGWIPSISVGSAFSSGCFRPRMFLSRPILSSCTL